MKLTDLRERYQQQSSFSNLSITSPTSQLILQPFRRFTYVTAYSPTLLLLYLRHRSFPNPSPTSQALHLIHLESRPCFVGMLFRMCAAGFALLLVLVSWLAIGRWYWYGDVGLKHKRQCALQLQVINMSLYKVSRASLVKLFNQNNNITAVALREYERIKAYGEVLFPYRVWRTWFGGSN